MRIVYMEFAGFCGFQPSPCRASCRLSLIPALDPERPQTSPPRFADRNTTLPVPAGVSHEERIGLKTPRPPAITRASATVSRASSAIAEASRLGGRGDGQVGLARRINREKAVLAFAVAGCLNAFDVRGRPCAAGGVRGCSSAERRRGRRSGAPFPRRSRRSCAAPGRAEP